MEKYRESSPDVKKTERKISNSRSRSRSRSQQSKRKEKTWTWDRNKSYSRSPKSRRRYTRSRSRSRSNSRSRYSARDYRRSYSRSRSRSFSSDQDSDGYRLHIADLHQSASKRDLEKVFMKFGPLKEIWLASYAPFYAFVVYRNKLDAEDARYEADGVEISGKRIRVTIAKPRRKGRRFHRSDTRARSRSRTR